MEIQSEITLSDIRKRSKEAGKGLFQRYYLFNQEEHLPQPIFEMAKDVLRLPNPDNVWSLFAYNIIFINHFPQEPDRFAPTFYFDAKCPPRTILNEGRLRIVDLEDVFSYRFRSLVEVADQTANIHAEKIGGVYPLQQALKNLDNPYYLASTDVEVETTPQNNPRIVVKATTEDLFDFTSLEINRLRRAKRKLSKQFSD